MQAGPASEKHWLNEFYDIGRRLAELEALKAVEPVAYLRASKEGKPLWNAESCVCEDPVYPLDSDDVDDDGEPVISMPVYTGPQLPQWKPIDSAPRDDTHFLCLWKDGFVMSVKGRNLFRQLDDDYVIGWMPLPSTPQPEMKK